VLKALTLRDWAGRIADKADKYSSGDMSFDLFEEVLDDVEAAKAEAGIHDKHDWEVLTNIREIIARVQDPGTGLNWRSPNLAASLGPLRKGKLVVCAAFVDTGKSTWLASEATFMATQLTGDQKVLYLNNEEAGEEVKLRLWKAALGMTTQDLGNDRLIEEKYAAHMGGDADRIILLDRARITPGMIRKKLRQYNVALLVVDQAYKVRVGKRAADDKLGSLQDTFEWFRGIAKEHCPVIAVHQARGDANGEKFIEMHQLAGSQQALQGEADAIITLGRDLEMPKARYIYVPKNKMEGSDDPEIRNIKAEVFPEFPTARFDQ
jgi:replicative DNA helicase